jgi:hypothetical protein
MLIFHQFTWQQFLIAALVLTVAWYVTIGLLYFRKELSGLRKPEKLKKDWEEELEDDSSQDDLMGGARAIPGMETVEMSEISFMPKEQQLGVIPDILEEFKSILYILERDNGGKAEFISLFGLVSAKYPQIKGSPNQDALNDYIRENLPFKITEEELEELWP